MKLVKYFLVLTFLCLVGCASQDHKHPNYQTVFDSYVNGITVKYLLEDMTELKVQVSKLDKQIENLKIANELGLLFPLYLKAITGDFAYFVDVDDGWWLTANKKPYKCKNTLLQYLDDGGKVVTKDEVFRLDLDKEIWKGIFKNLKFDESLK